VRLSLRAQLSVAIVLVTLAVVALVLASSRRQLVEEFARFDGGVDTSYVAQAAARLAAVVPHAGGTTWPGADSVLATVQRPPGIELVLQSSSGAVVGATREDLRHADLSGGSRGIVLSLHAGSGGTQLRLLFDAPPRRELHAPDGRLIGIVYSFHIPRPGRAGGAGAPLDPARGLVRRVLLAPLLGGALLSMALLFFAVSRVLAPLRAVTDATRRLAAGDRASRVPVAGASEVADLALAFNHMAESLERSEATRRQMVSDVAHELRTPLTNLRCRLEAMQDGLAAPDAAALHALHEETLLLSRLVEDLQLLSLADAGRLTLERQRVDVRELAGSAIAAMAPRAEAEGLTLSFADGPPAVADCDPARIGQVFRNLLANALAHTPRGGEVRVTVEAHDGSVFATVRDSGEGIAAEHLPHVFDRFWRADAARTREQGGAGLGLAIVRELVELHGGDITAASPPGEGATLRVRLPGAASFTSPS
jgi:two-component system sensor histidine kinase BaeS